MLSTLSCLLLSAATLRTVLSLLKKACSESIVGFGLMFVIRRPRMAARSCGKIRNLSTLINSARVTSLIRACLTRLCIAEIVGLIFLPETLIHKVLYLECSRLGLGFGLLRQPAIEKLVSYCRLASLKIF